MSNNILNKPKISIVVPFYNGREYLEETLNSFINQTFENWECIVIDDNSPESGIDICEKLKDSRIKYIKNIYPYGMAHARNKGVQVSQAELIALCDQDDLFLPNKLEIQLKKFKDDKDLILLGTRRINFGQNNWKMPHETNYEKIKLRLLNNSQFTNPSIMFRKKIFTENNINFNQELAPCDDYDFISKVAIIGKIENTKEYLFKYRIHDKQVSTQKAKDMEIKSNLIKTNYANEILKPWIEAKFDFKLLIEILTNNIKKDTNYIELFKQIINYNNTIKIFDDKYLKSFVGQLLLKYLSVNSISKKERFILVFSFRAIIFSFLQENDLKSGLKTLIRIILK